MGIESRLDGLKERARQKKASRKKLIKKLKSVQPRKLDEQVHALHEEVFAETDCLNCGNCCRTTGPMLFPKDVDRLASHLKMRPAEFTDQYLRTDEDGDLVFKSMPCPFLGDDNYCAVYEHRPKACREYPHTDRRKFHQLLDLSLKNAGICPAVEAIFERIDEQMR
jgi:Fe-S-cluster containining protein